MSTRAGIGVAVLVSAIAVSAIPTASAATAALRPCKSVTAGGKTWKVLRTATPSCATARSIVSRVAVAKPDQVLHAQGGVIDRYSASFSGLQCFKSSKASVGGEIQCTSRNGKQDVFGVYQR